jgi:amidase
MGELRDAAVNVPDLRLLDKRTQGNRRMGVVFGPLFKASMLHERFERKRLGRFSPTLTCVLSPTPMFHSKV